MKTYFVGHRGKGTSKGSSVAWIASRKAIRKFNLISVSNEICFGLCSRIYKITRVVVASAKLFHFIKSAHTKNTCFDHSLNLAPHTCVSAAGSRSSSFSMRRIACPPAHRINILTNNAHINTTQPKLNNVPRAAISMKLHAPHEQQHIVRLFINIYNKSQQENIGANCISRMPARTGQQSLCVYFSRTSCLTHTLVNW